MTPGEVGHLVAQSFITLLIVAASVIPAFAGLSALRKWREAQRELVEWDERNAALHALIAAHDEAMDAHAAAGGDAAESRRMLDEHLEQRRALGIPVKTYREHDVEFTLGERPRHSFQAPAEVKWAIVALACAAVAGIWDVWLG